MPQSSIQLDPEMKRKIAELAAWWDLPIERHTSSVLRRLVDEAHARESARRELAAHDAVVNRESKNAR